MADHSHGSGSGPAEDRDGSPHNHSDNPATGRTTSPMQAYSTKEVGIGFAVLLVGLLVVFGVPLLF
ncbi:hypothetical protein ACFO0N_12200 [Halobium salinum]|uniref:Uncharacterized protein n=1 Tax=Halobium salinum TaxID=1364940 RepID=A0ABD5PD49_9EURY|nr:hypothetical protein [Halobium salinum]